MARGKKDLGQDWWRQFRRAYLDIRPATVTAEVLPTATHLSVVADFAAAPRSPRLGR